MMSSGAQAPILGRRTVAASESWDEDFLFQNSSSDLHLPLQSSPRAETPLKQQQQQRKNSSPAASTSAWSSPGSFSILDEDEEPTLRVNGRNRAFSSASRKGTRRATTMAASSPSQSQQALRMASHSSSVSTGSSSAAADSPWARSGTPSLTSDWGGITTATETEADTEDWDRPSDTDGDTEVEHDQSQDCEILGDHQRQEEQQQQHPQASRMSSFSSVFRQKTLPQARQLDRDLPSDLRTFADRAGHNIKIIPYTPRRRRADSVVTQSTVCTPSKANSSASYDSPCQSPSRRSATRKHTYDMLRASQLMPSRQNSLSSVKGDRSTPRPYPSTSSPIRSPTSPKHLSPVDATHGLVDDVSDVSTTSADAPSSRSRRKLKRRSQTQVAEFAPRRTPSNSESQHASLIPPQESSESLAPSEDSANDKPRKLKKRPMSLTGLFNKLPSSSSAAATPPKSSTSPTSAAFSTGHKWFRSHRPSSSMSSAVMQPAGPPLSPTSERETGQTLMDALALPPGSSTSSFAHPPSSSSSSSHTRLFKPPRVFSSKSAASPATTTHTAFTSSPGRARSKTVTSTDTRTSAKSVLLKRRRPPPVAISTDPLPASQDPHLSTSTSEHTPSLRMPSSSETLQKTLPPLSLVTKPGSREQLSMRQVNLDVPSPEDERPRERAGSIPASAMRQNTYFTIGSTSTQGSSPGAETLFASGPSGQQAQRRLSLSDLRIPERITNAQAKIGQDLQRVKDFKSGVEELKQLRQSYNKQMTQAKLERGPGPSLRKSSRLIDRIQQQNAIYWECCDVLIDLAEGTDEFATGTPRRDRCVSMVAAVRPSPSKKAQRKSKQDGRHLELLKEMLGNNQELEPLAPKVSPKASKTSLNLKRSLSRDPAQKGGNDSSSIFSKRDTASRINIFSIRDFLHNLRRTTRHRGATCDEEVTEPSRPAMAKRTASEPPVTPKRKSPRQKQKEPTREGEGEESSSEEDWDRLSGSDSSSLRRWATVNSPVKHQSDQGHKRESQRGTGANRMALDGTNLPKLLEYLEHVNVRCTTCLAELEVIR